MGSTKIINNKMSSTITCFNFFWLEGPLILHPLDLSLTHILKNIIGRWRKFSFSPHRSDPSQRSIFSLPFSMRYPTIWPRDSSWLSELRNKFHHHFELHCTKWYGKGQHVLWGRTSCSEWARIRLCWNPLHSFKYAHWRFGQDLQHGLHCHNLRKCLPCDHWPIWYSGRESHPFALLHLHQDEVWCKPRWPKKLVNVTFYFFFRCHIL